MAFLFSIKNKKNSKKKGPVIVNSQENSPPSQKKCVKLTKLTVSLAYLSHTQNSLNIYIGESI